MALPSSGLDAKRVMHMLSSNLDKECKTWKPIFIRSSGDEGITEQQRDEAVAWVSHLSATFNFLPETCGLAVLLMDRVLQLVKVRSKYLQCVAITSLYIAAKTLEEDENIPATPDLVRKSQCGCSFAEITRMAVVILNKLNWDIRMPSVVDFLHTIHAVLIMHYPHLLSSQTHKTPSEHLSDVVYKMIRCLSCHALLRYRPSTVALALISLELEQITPGWLRLVLALQRMTNVGSEQLMQCRETMADFLGQQVQAVSTYSSRKSSSCAPRLKKLKVKHSLPDDDNIYDGIKQLYGDDIFTPAGSAITGSSSTDFSAVRASSCGLVVHQEGCDDSMGSVTHMGQSLLVN